MRLAAHIRLLIACCVLALAAACGGSSEPVSPAPTDAATAVAEVTAAETASASPDPAAPATATPTGSPATAAATTSSQAIPSATPTASAPPQPTPSAAPPATASPQPTPSAAPTATASPQPTPSAAPTPEPTPSATPTATVSPEPTATSGALPLEALPRIEFVRGDGTAASLPIEIPPRTEYTIGLSGRYELGERGMLFHWDDGMVRRSFWMKNTHIDLDIAFIGSDFVVQEIFGMEAESLDIRRPADAYQYAVEAPSGWYAANGVQAGDSARLLFDLADFLTE